MVPLQQQVQLPEVDEYDCTAHKVKANVVEKFLTLCRHHVIAQFKK